MVEDIKSENLFNNSLILIKNNQQQLCYFRKAYIFMAECCKRIIDIICGIVGCIFLIPLTIFVCIVKIVIKEKGRVFYVQQRIGKNGKLFKIYKYKTMVDNSEEVLNQLLTENDSIKQEYEKYKKIKMDPRITKLGKFLRSTSLDEFPQFFNVLIGNMSIIRTTSIFTKRKGANGLLLL